jgi:hypothetical protein
LVWNFGKMRKMKNKNEIFCCNIPFFWIFFTLRLWIYVKYNI